MPVAAEETVLSDLEDEAELKHWSNLIITEKIEHPSSATGDKDHPVKTELSTEGGVGGLPRRTEGPRPGAFGKGVSWLAGLLHERTQPGCGLCRAAGAFPRKRRKRTKVEGIRASTRPILAKPSDEFAPGADREVGGHPPNLRGSASIPRLSRTAPPYLSPAQRRREVVEIIATGLASMPLVPAIPPSGPARKLSKKSQKALKACVA